MARNSIEYLANYFPNIPEVIRGLFPLRSETLTSIRVTQLVCHLKIITRTDKTVRLSWPYIRWPGDLCGQPRLLFARRSQESDLSGPRRHLKTPRRIQPAGGWKFTRTDAGQRGEGSVNWPVDQAARRKRHRSQAEINPRGPFDRKFSRRWRRCVPGAFLKEYPESRRGRK